MAKVTGPLFSMSASGKLGNAIVHFGWKGINVVRQWVIPANKMSHDQGDQRIYVGGTGRACGTIMPAKKFAQQLIDLKLVPSGQTKQSYLVSYILKHFLNSTVNYAAELAAITGHTAYAAFGTSADALGIVEFDLDYAAVAPYNKALGLYLIAKTAIALGFVGTPYTVALTSWVTAQVAAMAADFTTA
jgi:hypothetical protein